MTDESGSPDLTNAQFFHHSDGKFYDGSLLGDGVGAYDDGWWIAVDDLKMVYQFYPNQIATSPKTGLPTVLGYDFQRSFDQLRDEGVARQFFADARDPGLLVRLMKMINLLQT